MGRLSALPRHALTPPRQKNLRMPMALAVVVTLFIAMFTSGLAAQQASATGGGNGSNPQCTTEYEWVKKGKEYRWKTVYKEAKQLKGWYVELPNTWKQGDPNTWYDLPSEKQPPRSDQVAPTGTVPLSVYGGPRNVSTQYQYKTSYTEFFPSETGFSAGPPPAGKDWGNPIAEQVVVVDGPKWSAASPGQGWEKTGKSQQVNCFDPNWTYPAPTCEGVTIAFPANLPKGQQGIMEVNVTNGSVAGMQYKLEGDAYKAKYPDGHAGKTVFISWTDFRNYSIPATGVWTVTGLQVHGTNYHWSGTLQCGENPPPTPKDASASFSVDTGATCTDPSTVKFNLVHATLDSEPVNTPGEHTVGVTAKEGHLFADGTNKMTLTYTIDDKLPADSPECYVPPTPKVCVAFEDGPTATNLDEAGWNHNDTRSTGKYEYVNGGIRLSTTDTDNPGSSQNKVTLYRSVEPTLLSDFGEPSVEFLGEGTGVRPGMQVGVDVNGDGTFDGYLVGEPWSYGEHNWWTNKAGFNVPSGMGYASFGSWADFVAANPQAKVVSVGLSLGSGVLGDWTVKSFTANCVTYTFDYTKPIVKDAVASVSEKEQPSCTAPGTVDFTIENATWDGEADLSVGTHTRTATANDGHLFADGSDKASVTYTIEDKKPSQSTDPEGECYVPPTALPSNPQYEVYSYCGGYSAIFTNEVELTEEQTALDAEFTYTDKFGETQLVTVPANQVVSVSVVFPEDSGEHLVKIGLKGEEQEEFTVQTDCVQPPVSFTPTSPTFKDVCLLTNDAVVIDGKLVASTSSTDNLTGIVYRYESYSVATGTYYVSYEQNGNRLTSETWFVPNTPNAVPTAPGKNDTYTVENGLAVWRHTFTNEACPAATPPGKGSSTPAAAPVRPSHTGLAITGAQSMALLGVAGLLLLVGGGAVVLSRRRRNNGTTDTASA